MIKNLVLFLTPFMLCSCFFGKGNGIEMKIKNDCETTITEVRFTTTEKLETIYIAELEPNEAVSQFLPMAGNKMDGAYLLSYTRANGKKETIERGYYTNGAALDRWIKFTIAQDTVLVDFDGPVH